MFEQIRQSWPSLSRSQRVVAAYLSQNPSDLSYASAAAIGAASGVSEATVLRLARALGYSGFPDMQAAWRAEQDRGMRTLARQRTLSESFRDDPDLLGTVIQRDISLLQDLHATLPREVFQQAADVLSSAGAVYVVGGHYAHAMAMLFHLFLRAAVGHVQLLVPGQPDLEWHLATCNAQTAVVGISLPRYSTATLQVLTVARSHGGKVIGITDNPLSPIGEVADLVLPVPVSAGEGNDSFTAVFSLLYALFTAVAAEDGGPGEELMRRLESTYQSCGTFARTSPNPPGHDHLR